MLSLTHTDLAPITLAATHQENWQPQSLVGQATVIFFYPKNNTPGCTQEVKDFRDFHPQFTQANVRVIGVSRDTLGSHQRFSKKHSLPYPLVADTDEQLCQYFDVIKHKSMFGKQVKGIVRSTFLFDAQGNLIKEWRKVSVNGHVEEVLGAVTLTL